MLDKGFRLLDQQLPIRRWQQRETAAAYLLAQGGKVGVQAPLHLFEVLGGAPVLADPLHQGDGLFALRVADQQQQLAIQRLLYTLLGLLHPFVSRTLWQQGEHARGHRRAVAPLPGGQRQQRQQ
ncbi:hypothetical protein D9M68_712390 [compost metagenome]